MENFLGDIQNNPYVILIIAALALAISLLLVFPTFFSYIKSLGAPLAGFGTKKKSEEQLPEKKSKKELPKLNINFNFKSAKTLVLAGLVLLIVAGGGYFAYDFFYRPVRIVNAWQLKIEQGGKLTKLQKGGLAVWPNAKIYLLDIRSRETYAAEHLVGSESLPANRAKQEFYPLEDTVVVVYSSEFNFEDSKKVADAMIKNGKSGIVKIKKPGKVYVIKNGFEGLRASGLKIEEGGWD